MERTPEEGVPLQDAVTAEFGGKTVFPPTSRMVVDRRAPGRIAPSPYVDISARIHGDARAQHACIASEERHPMRHATRTQLHDEGVLTTTPRIDRRAPE